LKIQPDVGDVSLAGAGRHVTVPTPTATTDAATKAYVDAAVSAAGGGLKVYQSDGTTLVGNFLGIDYTSDNIVYSDTSGNI